MVVFTPKLSNW